VSGWRWSALFLAAAAIAAPGCLLVQPLDDVNDAGSADDSIPGKAGSGAAPSGGRGGSGPTANGGRGGGSGPTASGGRGGAASGGKAGAGPTPSGGAPNSVDFSYFTGIWTVTSGTITTDCGTGPEETDAMAGTKDKIDLGTTSDLIVDKGTECAILMDVYDLVGVGEDGQSCDFTNDSGSFHVEISSYSFIVDDNHQTASATLTSVITLTKNGVAATCDSNQDLFYTR
jgi:hypothetical protein